MRLGMYRADAHLMLYDTFHGDMRFPLGWIPEVETAEGPCRIRTGVFSLLRSPETVHMPVWVKRSGEIL